MATKPKMGKVSFDDLFYPGTQTLINHFDERNPSKLVQIERDFSAIVAVELRLRPIPGNFDLEHMQKIHKKLFGDVYPFAGQVREYPVFKQRPDGLVTEFARPNEIVELDKQLKEIIERTKGLTTVKPKDVPRELARIYQIANEMHPFREGNGRTQRIYLDYLAARAGHKLDFKLVDKEAWNYAASMSGKVSLGGGTRVDGRTDELEKVFKHIARAIEQGNAYTKGRVAGPAEKQPVVLTMADLNSRLAAEKKASYRFR